MRITIILCLMLLPVYAPAQSADENLPFVNWENPPIHPLDLSPDGLTLAVTNTPDNRVEVFDLTTGAPRLKGSVVVGVDPVSVRFRDNNEAWVVNHISDSVSVVNTATLQVTATIQTLDEPADVVFAGNPQRAYVSCSSVNTIQQFRPNNLEFPAVNIAIEAEDPRALAVSPDGNTVYAAIFESGNGTTVLAGGVEDVNDTLAFPPQVVNVGVTPYAGQNPPPNNGNGFFPPMAPGLPQPPRVSQIVRQADDGRWLDDNDGDWTNMISGSQSGLSGRAFGWTLLDRDIAIIDTASLNVTYAERLMNIGMALAVNPANGRVVLVGTEATNEKRFEPNINGTFVRVHWARVNANGSAPSVLDLNAHLDYQSSTVNAAQRGRSVGDPRGVDFSPDGATAWITGMGSNNVLVVDAGGERVGDPIAVGDGPTGLVFDGGRNQVYVWNRFEASLSVIDANTRNELKRVALFDPTPEAIRSGRPFFYDTHETSGLGQLACASCHVDGRTDRLAWDLGNPAGSIKPFNQNCQTSIDDDGPCDDFHPMKGPMLTQTFQDIIGHEPFHWRGDRNGLEEFNPAFTDLMGRPQELTPQEMQAFEDFVASIAIPPNPFRNLDNSLPTDLPLPGHFTTGHFSNEGQPLPNGDAENGLDLYRNAFLDDVFQCNSCHTLPTGMSSNGPLQLSGSIPAGGSVFPTGPLGENHLGIVSVDGLDQRSFKTPQLRTLYDRVGMRLTQRESLAGFGYLHDGSIDSIERFVTEPAFSLQNDQEVADMVALLLAFAGSDFPTQNPDNPGQIPTGQDTHAAVGTQLFDDGDNDSETFTELQQLATNNRVDLVVHGVQNDEARGWLWSGAGNQFLADRAGENISQSDLRALAGSDGAQVWTAVPSGLGERLALDRDGDGVFDGDERDQGSDPADASSTTLSPKLGMWFNPARSGHGIDLQRAGDTLFVVWFTYDETGAPTWYLAVAEFTGPQWSADLQRITFPGLESEVVGTLSMSFSDAEHASFDYTINGESGSEAFERLIANRDFTPSDHTGHWFPPTESGYGFTINMQGLVEFTLMYYYDAEGNPRWVLGSNANAGPGNSIDVMSFTGFCPTCETIDVTSAPAGSISHNLNAPDTGTVTTQVTYPGDEGGNWNKTNVSISSLSDPVMD